MKEQDLYWLAGFLEGEGSFLAGPPSCPNMPSISAVTTDEDVASKAAKLLGKSYWRISEKRSEENGWKTPFVTRIRGKKAVDIMIKLRPLMGERRQSQIDKAVKSYNGSYYKLDAETVKSIKTLLARGFTQTSVAKKFGICRETVNKIHNKKIWTEVEL